MVKTLGSLTISFNLPNIANLFTWKFYVADVTHPILGSDFLCSNSLAVDCRSRRLFPSPGSTKFVASVVPTPELDYSRLPNFVQTFLNQFPNLTTNSTTRNAALDSKYFHRIETNPTPPLHERVRIMSNEKLDFVRAEFAELLNAGIVRRSSSPWASPVHIISKPDGSFRLCGDYRRLNKITIHDSYTMPVIKDVLQRLPNATIFTTLDLRKAYHQIPVRECDVEKTAVTTPIGLFEYLFMPFGLRNAAQTFQRHIDHVLEKLQYCSIVYIDDILIGSKDVATHQQDVAKVLKALSDFNLKLNINKCDFCKPEIRFLGHLISAKGIKPLPHRAEIILKFPLPKTVSQLRSFLGTINFCHRFIPNISDIVAPLSALCTGRKQTVLKWNESTLFSFENAKKALQSMTTLSFPKTGLPLTLTTDASNFAAGAALHQINNGVSEPLEFFSKKFDAAQQKYSAFDRELTAIFLAIKHFKYLLDGRSFTIFTDHKPLLHLLTMRDPSPRQQRQINFISQFSCKIQHIAGKENIIADCLSRCHAITHGTLFSAQQLLDNPPTTDEISIFKDHYLLSDGIHFDSSLSGTLRPILGQSLRKLAFTAIHNIHHPGSAASFELLKTHVIWPGMRKDVKNWVAECLDCQKFKIHKHTKPPLMHFPTGNRFDTVHIDLVGPLPPSQGYTYLLTMIDRKTRWFEVVPVRNITAETIAKNFVQHWIARYGVPQSIISDRGAQFESDLFNSLARHLNIKHLRTTSYHPQTNGMLERFHRTLKTSLAILSTNYQWHTALPFVLMAWRNTPSKTTGCSPAQLLFGVSISLPNQLVDFNTEPTLAELAAARDHFLSIDSNPLFSASHAYKPYIPKSFEHATHVWIRAITDSNFKPRYQGPFPLRSIKDNVARVEINGIEETINLARLKPAFGISSDATGGSPVFTPNNHVSFYEAPRVQIPRTPLEIMEPPQLPPETQVQISSRVATSVPKIDATTVPPETLPSTSSSTPINVPPITRTIRTRSRDCHSPSRAATIVNPTSILRSTRQSTTRNRGVTISPWVRIRRIGQKPDSPTRLERRDPL